MPSAVPERRLASLVRVLMAGASSIGQRTGEKTFSRAAAAHRPRAVRRLRSDRELVEVSDRLYVGSLAVRPGLRVRASGGRAAAGVPMPSPRRPAPRVRRASRCRARLRLQRAAARRCSAVLQTTAGGRCLHAAPTHPLRGYR